MHFGGGGQTKEYVCKTTHTNVPFLKVNSAYVDLTTKTISGIHLEIKHDNQIYRPMCSTSSVITQTTTEQVTNTVGYSGYSTYITSQSSLKGYLGYSSYTSTTSKKRNSITSYMSTLSMSNVNIIYATNSGGAWAVYNVTSTFSNSLTNTYTSNSSTSLATVKVFHNYVGDHTGIFTQTTRSSDTVGYSYRWSNATSVGDLVSMRIWASTTTKTNTSVSSSTTGSHFRVAAYVYSSTLRAGGYWTRLIGRQISIATQTIKTSTFSSSTSSKKTTTSSTVGQLSSTSIISTSSSYSSKLNTTSSIVGSLLSTTALTNSSTKSSTYTVSTEIEI